MATPFAFAGSLQLPADAGLQPDSIAIAMSGQFDSENKQVLNLSGSGSKTIPFGTIGSAGLKALLIKVEASSTAAAILVTINGGDQPVEIAPGGFLAFGSPSPTSGITTLTIAYTSVNKVTVWALG